MLRPIARFCLRHSLRVQDLLEMAKVALLEEAEILIRSHGEKVNVSRLSVMSGIHRRDVMRIYKRDEAREEPRSVIAQVIGRWQQDKRFLTKAGRARVLSLEGPDNEFRKLVYAVSQDLNAGTVLFELERVGAVRRTRGGLELVTRAYVPRGDAQAGLSLLAADTCDLMGAVEENIFAAPPTPNLHAKTEYDRIPASRAEEVRKWMLREGSALHERARRYLASLDLDMRKKGSPKTPPSVRVAIGTFGLVESRDEAKRSREED